MKQAQLNLILKQTELSEIEPAFLYLMPLVQIAWAHGAISPREKRKIFDAARADRIDERSPLNDTLADLLKYQPSRAFFDDCLSQIAEDLRRMTVRERTDLREKILHRCREVAASAGEKSLMDLNHHISSEERNLLEWFEEILK